MRGCSKLHYVAGNCAISAFRGHRLEILSFVLLFSTLVLISGCAVPAPLPAVLDKQPFRKLVEKHRVKAVSYEEKADIPRALLNWRIVAQLRPDDGEAAGKVKNLLAKARSKSDEHFGKGLDLLKNNEGQSARREFLLALAYNPEHREALDYLKKYNIDQDYSYYTTGDGDTLRRIAEEKYGDSQKDFIIAYFNDLNNGRESAGPLKAGLALKLPVLEPFTGGRSGYFEKNKVKSPQKITRAPEEAPASRQNLEPEYSLRLQREAEEHYIKGIAFFLAEELDKAAQEWKQTLRLNPSHPKARKDLEKVQRLLEQLKKFR